MDLNHRSAGYEPAGISWLPHPAIGKAADPRLYENPTGSAGVEWVRPVLLTAAACLALALVMAIRFYQGAPVLYAQVGLVSLVLAFCLGSVAGWAVAMR